MCISMQEVLPGPLTRLNQLVRNWLQIQENMLALEKDRDRVERWGERREKGGGEEERERNCNNLGPISIPDTVSK